jgi:hypothetical protein
MRYEMDKIMIKISFFARKSLSLLLILLMFICLSSATEKANAQPPPPPGNPITVIPNPFDPNEKTDDWKTTTLSYYLYSDALLWLKIYDLDGNLKYGLESPPNNYTVDPVYGTAGDHSIVWDGTGTTEYGTYPYRMDDIRFVGVTSDRGYNMFDAVVDPTNSARLWMTDATPYLWQSDDGGVNWQPVMNLYNPAASVCPCYGIAISSSNGGRIYVLDNGQSYIHYAVCVGDPWVCTWDNNGAKSLPLWSGANNPLDIACTSDGNTLYAVDKGTGYLYQGTVSCVGNDCNVSWVQKAGSATAKPTGVAVDPNLDNVIFVADSTATKVYKSTDYGGSFTTVLDTVGAGDGAFYGGNGPYQISIDTNGYYWVSDVGYHRVHEFDSDNKWVMTVGGTSAGDGDYQFRSGGNRLGITVALFDGQSYLGVASLIHHRFKKFAYDNYESDIIFQNEADDPIVTDQLDFIPPGKIQDLLATAVGYYDDSGTLKCCAIELTWTAPGDDDYREGTRARTYDLRYSKTPITNDAEFYAATQVTLPTPKKAPNGESFTKKDLESNTKYYFAIRAKDEYQWSELPDPKVYPPVWAKTGLLWEWNMVSCPLLPDPDDSYSVFYENTGMDFDWVWDWFSTWSGVGDIDDPDYDGYWYQVSTIDPGKGLILLTYNTEIPTDAAGDVISDDSQTFQLKAGWNLIGNPYRQNSDEAPAIVDLASCRVKRCPDENWYAFGDKISSDCSTGWIGNALYIWNGSDYVFSTWDVAQLEPWKGYWIFACCDMDLKICKPDIPIDDNPECNLGIPESNECNP